MADDTAFEPISEEEYGRWLTPKQALAKCPNPIDCKTNALALMNRAMHGRIRTAVEQVETAQGGRVGHEEFVILPPGYWSADIPIWPCHFWTTGDHHLVLNTSPQLYVNVMGVRFDPAGVDKLCQQLSDVLPERPITEPPVDTKLIVDAAVASALEYQGKRADKLDPLSVADADKFCGFILEVRPGISERDAHQRAVQVFPDRKVPRDWFWNIFRSIRGPKNPGRVPKSMK